LDWLLFVPAAFVQALCSVDTAALSFLPAANPAITSDQPLLFAASAPHCARLLTVASADRDIWDKPVIDEMQHVTQG
jgi:hypothetical protein